jgi:hypothetical protein
MTTRTMTPEEEMVEDVIAIQLAVLSEFMAELHADGHDWAVQRLTRAVEHLDSTERPTEKVRRAATVLREVRQRFLENKADDLAMAILTVRRALTDAADRYLPDTQRIGTGEFRALLDDSIMKK